MKKLVLALAATTVAVSAASATVSTGFYLGGHIGYGNAKAKMSTGDATGTSTMVDAGNDAANIGIHGGYGFLTGCWYFGGELFYTFENIKMRSVVIGAPNTSAELKRNGYYGIALRAGYVFMQNTMFYVRLGGHMGKWRLTSDFYSTVNTINASKNRFSFAPGVGIETAIHRNLFLRGEWFYEFGPSIRGTNSNYIGGSFVNAGSIRYNSFRLGLTYKF